MRIPVSNPDLSHSNFLCTGENTEVYFPLLVRLHLPRFYFLPEKLRSTITVRAASLKQASIAALWRYGNAYSRRVDAVDPSLKSTKVDIETLLAVRVSKRIRAGEPRKRNAGRKKRRERKKDLAE